MDGTPRFSVLPLTGHPVSVTQIGLLVTPWVLVIASSKSDFPLEMELDSVFWKYG
jgi:hypothetical protein